MSSILGSSIPGPCGQMSITFKVYVTSITGVSRASK